MQQNKINNFLHLLAGLLLLLHGFGAFEKQHQVQTVLFLSCSFVFLLWAGIPKHFKKQLRNFEGLFILLEGAALVYSAIDYKLTGGTYLFAVNLVFALIFLSFAIRLTTINKHKRRYRRNTGQ